MSSERFYDENGFDVWGYDRSGHYEGAYDRTPYQSSPFPTCPACDNKEPCEKLPGALLQVWEAPVRV